MASGVEEVTADTAPPDRQDEESDLSRDESFDLLSNHRRRYALYCLRQEENRATLGELADKIAAWENDIETDAVSYDERKRVYTSLQQVHLPRMDDLDVVELTTFLVASLTRGAARPTAWSIGSACGCGQSRAPAARGRRTAGR